MRRPTLDDVFLTLTGHKAEHNDADPDQDRQDTTQDQEISA